MPKKKKQTSKPRRVKFNFGKNLGDLIEEAGLSTDEVAKAAKLSTQTIRRWIKAKKATTPNDPMTIKALSEKLGVSASRLLYGEFESRAFIHDDVFQLNTPKGPYEVRVRPAPRRRNKDPVDGKLEQALTENRRTLNAALTKQDTDFRLTERQMGLILELFAELPDAAPEKHKQMFLASLLALFTKTHGKLGSTTYRS